MQNEEEQCEAQFEFTCVKSKLLWWECWEAQLFCSENRFLRNTSFTSNGLFVGIPEEITIALTYWAVHFIEETSSISSTLVSTFTRNLNSHENNQISN